MNHATVEVSVASADVMTKLVAAVFAVTAMAFAAATVPKAWQLI